jgi:hypothetical protein
MATKKSRAAKKSTKAATAEPQMLAASVIPQSTRLINFDRAEVRPGFLPRTYFLIVSGTKPYLNMQVHLSPLIYIKRPEYWGIEVIGTLPGIGLPALAPYHVSIPLDGITGTKGVEVIGANKRKKINVSPSKGSKKSK